MQSEDMTYRSWPWWMTHTHTHTWKSPTETQMNESLTLLDKEDCHWTADQLHESKAAPARQVKTESLVPAEPPKRVKTSLWETLRVKNHLFFDSGDSFLTLFGGGRGHIGDSPGDSFLTFRAGAAFHSCSWSAGSQDCHWNARNTWELQDLPHTPWTARITFVFQELRSVSVTVIDKLMNSKQFKNVSVIWGLWLLARYTHTSLI